MLESHPHPAGRNRFELGWIARDGGTQVQANQRSKGRLPECLRQLAAPNTPDLPLREILCMGWELRMKILFVLVSVGALFLGACVDQPLISDEEYNARHGPAPPAPDPTRYLPVTSDRPPGM
jgi:hypothetical protein